MDDDGGNRKNEKNKNSLYTQREYLFLMHVLSQLESIFSHFIIYFVVVRLRCGSLACSVVQFDIRHRSASTTIGIGIAFICCCCCSFYLS